MSSSPEAPWYFLDWRAASHHSATCPSDKTFVNLSQTGAKPFHCSLPNPVFPFFLLSRPLVGGDVRGQGSGAQVCGRAESYSAQSTRGYTEVGWGADRGGIRASPRNNSTSE